LTKLYKFISLLLTNINIGNNQTLTLLVAAGVFSNLRDRLFRRRGSLFRFVGFCWCN